VGFAERARADASAQVWIHQADAEVARTGKRGGNSEGNLWEAVWRETVPSVLRQHFPGCLASLGTEGLTLTGFHPSPTRHAGDGLG
jgi:hypothetical protein